MPKLISHVPDILEERCIHCGNPYGLVLNLPGYRNQWCHLGCAQKQTPEWSPPGGSTPSSVTDPNSEETPSQASGLSN
jgi:hypothetical protein